MSNLHIFQKIRQAPQGHRSPAADSRLEADSGRFVRRARLARPAPRRARAQAAPSRVHPPWRGAGEDAWLLAPFDQVK